MEVSLFFIFFEQVRSVMWKFAETDVKTNPLSPGLGCPLIPCSAGKATGGVVFPPSSRELNELAGEASL